MGRERRKIKVEIGTEDEDNSTEKQRKLVVKKRKSMRQSRDKWQGKDG
jgi:hypothetical protein